MRMPASRSDLLACRGLEHRNAIERVPLGFPMGLLDSASNALSLKRREKGFCNRVAVADTAPAHRSSRRTCQSAPHSKGPIWAADFIEAQKFQDGRTPRIDWRGIYPALSSFLGSSINALTGDRMCRLRRTTDRLEVGRLRTGRFQEMIGGQPPFLGFRSVGRSRQHSGNSNRRTNAPKAADRSSARCQERQSPGLS